MKAFRALRNRNYRWYWISGCGQTGAQGIRQFVLAWLVLDLTGSVAQLGIVVFIQGVPMTVIALFGGVLTDRFDRRNILLASQAMSMANLITLGVLTLTGHIELWHVYTSSVLLGVSRAIMRPARQAFIRSLVSRDETMNAVALKAIQMHSSRILWPSAAGFLIAWVGIGPTLVVNAGFLVVGIGALYLVRVIKEAPSIQGFAPFRQMAEGFRYTRATPLIGTLITLGFAVGFLGMPFMQMLPGFARQELGFNAAQTGLLAMFTGIGALVGSSSLLVFEIKEKGRLYTRLVVLLCIALIAFPLNPWFLGAFVLMIIVGFAGFTQTALAHTIFQTTVPTQYLGRVFSLWSAAGGLISGAALPFGFIGDAYGLRWAFGGAAALLLLVTIWLGMIRVPLRSMPVNIEDEPATIPNRTMP